MAETVQQYVERMLGLAGDRDPVEVLRGTAHRLAALITARTDEDLRFTSSPGRWSTAAILAHLADAEVVASYRIRMILASPGIEIQAFDQNAWAAAFRYTDQDPFASLALFQSLRLAWLALVDTIAASEPDDSWRERYGVHQERGQESIAHLLRLYAGHDLNHEQQIERLLGERDRERGSGPPAFELRPVKPVIGNDGRQQLDVRVGTIRSVHEVAGASRLMKLVVDFGDRDRTVIAGIKQERTNAAALAGRQALFIVNVAPRAVHGQVSEAMLFDVGFEDGLRPGLAAPEWPMPNGARAG